MLALFRGLEHQSIDGSGQWHVFRGHPVVSYWSGIGLLAAAPLFAIVGIVGGPIDFQSLELWAFAVFGAWFGVRCLRVGVVASAHSIRSRNYFQTRSAERSEIAAINLVGRNEGEAGYHWIPQVQLIDGSRFWISTLDCGPTRNSPRPDRLGQVHEIRRILQVGGTDEGGHQPRPGLLKLIGIRRS